MADQNHLLCVQLKSNGLQILHGSCDGVILDVAQECRGAAAGLIVQIHAKAVGG
jgi:hypothetical protein